MLEYMIIGGRVPEVLGMNFMHELKVHADLAQERYSWAKKQFDCPEEKPREGMLWKR